MSGFNIRIAFCSILVGISILGTLALAQNFQITDIPFQAKPSFEADGQGNFSGCGYQIAARRLVAPLESWSLVITVTQNRKGHVFIEALTAKGQGKDGELQPIGNYLQWIRIGNLPPIKSDEYSSVRSNERGWSLNGMDPVPPLDYISPILNKKTVLTASVFYPPTQSTISYSGIFEMSEASSAQIKQCLQSIR